MSKREKRSDNWLPEEVELLTKCVDERRKIIEEKSAEPGPLKNKKKAWLEIYNIFKANGYDREPERMKEKWRRLKDKSKKEIRAYSKELRKTGGGGKPKSPSPTSFQIKDICTEDFITDVSMFDSDGTANMQEKEYYLDEETGTLKEIPSHPEPNIVAEVANNSQNNTPITETENVVHHATESTRVSAPRKRKQCSMSVYEEELLKLSESKINIEIKHMKETHEEEMRQLEIERKTKEVNLNLNRIREKAEEIKLETAILEKEKLELELKLLKEKLKN